MEKPVYIACDDSGYELKVAIMERLDSRKIEYVNCGSGAEPSRYPYYAARVASAVSGGKADRGILICGSGIGMSIAANKYAGVRASEVWDSYGAYLTRRHNDSNVLCLGGRLIGVWTALEIVDTWLDTAFDGGHHVPSLELLDEIERVNLTGQSWCPDELPYEPFEWDPDQKL